MLRESPGLTSSLVKLLYTTPSLSKSAIDNKKGVWASTMWKTTSPTGVEIFVDPIDPLVPIPKQANMVPAVDISSSSVGDKLNSLQ